MSIPDTLRYTREHEWIDASASGPVRVGVTRHAADELGDVVYVSLPSPGDQVVAGQACGEIESTKSVADLFAPASGTVVAVNSELETNPELVNADPYEQGWLYTLEVSTPPDDLLDAAAYSAFVG